MGAYHWIQRILAWLAAAALLSGAVAWGFKGRLGTHDRIVPELLREPIQRAVSKPSFSFDYMGETYEVQPVATYQLWGLVVAHNNPKGIMDYYHDRKSVDTRDLGVIWGPNLRSNDFRKVKYWSGSWTVNFRYPGGVRFHRDAISNNHLITDDPALRKAISRVRVGDQVHISGLLVNYRSASNPQFWRKSSTTRNDAGNGACEVFFVKAIKVLQQGTPLWYLVYTIAKWTLTGALLAKSILFLVSVFRSPAP